MLPKRRRVAWILESPISCGRKNIRNMDAIFTRPLSISKSFPTPLRVSASAASAPTLLNPQIAMFSWQICFHLSFSSPNARRKDGWGLFFILDLDEEEEEEEEEDVVEDCLGAKGSTDCSDHDALSRSKRCELIALDY